jgi:hypothetical protein
VTLEGLGINTIYDLKGKRVSIGEPGSQTEIFVKRLLEICRIDIDTDFAAVERLSASRSADALADGKINAFFFNAAPPTAAVIELAAKKPIKIIPIPEDARDAMIEKWGGYVKMHACLLQVRLLKRYVESLQNQTHRRRCRGLIGLPAKIFQY